MSYNSLLDTYFGTYWIGLVVSLVLMLLYFLLRKFIMRGREYTFAERTIVIAVCALVALTSGLINPIYWGYGHPQAIDDIRIFGDKLVVMDHIMTMGSDTDEGERRSRIHVLNPATGEKLLRFAVGGESDLIGLHGDSLGVSRYADVAYFSISTGEKYVVYDKESLPGQFPQLASGVEYIMWGDGRTLMEITAMDGSQWNLHTPTGKLLPANQDRHDGPYIPTNLISIHDDEIRLDDRPGQSQLLQLDGENGNQHQLFVCDDHSTPLNRSQMFLDGKLVGLSVPDSCFFIFSYESLKNEQFKLTCMKLDGKRSIWEVHQTQFNPDYKYREPYTPHFECDPKAGLVWVSLDQEVLALDLHKGTLVWRTAL